MQSGDVDFDYHMDAEQYYTDLSPTPEWVKTNYVKADWWYPTYSYVGWNLLKDKFQDRRVRVALALLNDNQKFIDKKLHGAGIAVSGGQYYFGPAYDHELRPLAYDVQTARDLLAEAGWTDTKRRRPARQARRAVQIHFTHANRQPNRRRTDGAVPGEPEEAGIGMEVVQLDWASMLEKVLQRDFEAIRLGWASELESDPYQLWHSSFAKPDARSSNHPAFANAQADRLINQIRENLDKGERSRLYFDLQRLIDSEQPYVFLYMRRTSACITRNSAA